MAKAKRTRRPVINQTDLVALRKSLAIMRASSDPADGQYVAMHLQDERWDEVAANCAHTLQSRSLALKPWQVPPCHITDIAASLEVPENDHRGFRPAARMLRRMLALGVSKFDPDPVRAISDAEQRAALQNDDKEWPGRSQ
jgi:hypothetical protein